ncbi:type I restriction-modification system subunit M [Corynebacterium ammoniagenes]|uniref:type I restriction-modification system subunit M n=1 Tax=Corynebacterium ammoniagenes TaxID=1697 RepID=UPI0014592228|nr:type I restriction-modification system subunit M [Corynebacterium ammoniagenes]
MDKQQVAHRIWETANTMRSKIEANEYKDYILGFIFYKFLSDQVEQLMFANGAESDELEELLVEDDRETVDFVRNNLGYFIAYGNLYSTWRDKGQDFNVADVRDGLAAFARLIHPTRKHVFEGIFKTLETGLSKLGDNATTQTNAIRKLLDLITDIPTDGKQGYDILGFIYEYLIEKFAANAGKKAGEFYTPHEVSLLMSHIIADHLKGRSEIQIYDPASGSGSLLLNIGQAVAKHMGDPDRIKYFAQELKENTYNLTRMNLVMRGVKADNIVTRCGDSLAHDWPMFDESDPESTYEPLYVDAVVSNPPYSQSWEPEGNDTDPRFARFGLAPKTKADYAFLLHELFHVKPDGILTIVLPHGVLFRGGSEADIRRNLIEHNHIDTVIGLPSNIFYGTGIATTILVLKQRRDRDDILFVDASQGFEKVGKFNHLRARDIQRVVDTVLGREDVEHFARVVSRDEIRENDYNLNIPRYVSATLPPEPVDLFATMHGGIPASELDELADYWGALPGLREALFDEDAQGYAQLRDQSIRDVIVNHDSAAALTEKMDEALDGLSEKLHTLLIEGAATVPVNTTEDVLKTELFSRLTPVPLVDPYEGYQLLHERWTITANDLEIIQTEGLDAVRRVDPVMEWKTRSGNKVHVQVGWEGRVAPFALIESLYLPELTAEVADAAQQEQDIAAELTEIIESLTEEDKADLGDALNEKQDAFKKTELNALIKLLPAGETWQEGSLEETQLRAKQLLADQTKVKKALKDAKAQLEDQTIATINELTAEQVDEVLTHKWITALVEDLATMPTLALNGLAARVQALHDKYAVSLAGLDSTIHTTERELGELIGSLTGSDADMQAVSTLQELLGGSNE